MIKFLGKNKFENKIIFHKFFDGQTPKDLFKIYGSHKLLFKPEQIYDGACAILTNLNQNFYVVKPTDTFLSISKKLGISKETLLKKNKNQKLFVGQILNY